MIVAAVLGYVEVVSTVYDVTYALLTYLNDGSSLEAKQDAAAWAAFGLLAPGPGNAYKKIGGVADEAGEAVAHIERKGGSYKSLRGTVPGAEVHHMPAKSASPLSPNDGPAIIMEQADHRQTASWGNSRSAQQYRSTQEKMISQGNFLGAQQMDSNDVQQKFGNKYDAAIQQMKSYTDKIIDLKD